MSIMRRSAYATMKVLSGAWRATNHLVRPRLRILAYHDIPDPKVFDRQMAHLVDRYICVDGPPQLEDRSAKPPVWVTFDDGDPTIVEHAMEILDKYNINATAFVCPGVIDTDTPFWWEIVQAAVEAGLTVDGRRIEANEVNRLKGVQDDERREIVAVIRDELTVRTGRRFARQQITIDQVDRWIRAGHSVGNHSWDHPLLDRCRPEEQIRQVDVAHGWFIDRGFGEPAWFAFPNGSWSAVAETRLRDLGYMGCLLFDHRLASVDDPMRMSRLRVSGTDTESEYAAKVSGVHSAVMGWRINR